MVEFSNKEELRQWLEDKPIEWSQVIAIRASLRVMPVVSIIISLDKINQDLLNNLTLNIGRTLLISGIAVYGSLPDIRRVRTAANATADSARATRATYVAAADAAAAATYAADATAATTYAVAAAAAAVAAAADAAAATHATAAVNAAAADADAAAAAARATHATANATAATYAAADAHATTTRATHDAATAARATHATATANTTHATYAAAAADANLLEQGISPTKLIKGSLWQEGTSNPFSKKWSRLKQQILFSNPNGQFWIDWYEAKLDGTTYIGLTQAQEDELYSQIAMFSDKNWNEGYEAVNARIAELFEAVKKPQTSYDFFLSYATEDEKIAQRVAAIVEGEGYSVFAQFKDMPVGSNFITEMQNGLRNSSHFICLYSNSYWSSDYCQQEWNAAITSDPLGKLRKIIPFLTEHIELPVLARPLIYKSLIGLNEEKFRKAVIDAITPREPISAAEARTEAKKSSSPDAIINEDGKLDISANSEYDKVQLTENLYRLPDRQIALINTLLSVLENKNAPSFLNSALKEYQKELLEKGIGLSVGLLNDQITLIEIAIEENDENDWCNKLISTGIKSLLSNHSLIKTHYPLAPLREQFIQDAPLNPARFDDDAFIQLIHTYDQSLKNLADEKLTAEQLVNYAKARKNLYKEIENLSFIIRHPSDENAVISVEKEISVDDLKKRYMMQESGFADRISELLSKSDKLASSPTLKSFAKIAKELADWIWS